MLGHYKAFIALEINARDDSGRGSVRSCDARRLPHSIAKRHTSKLSTIAWRRKMFKRLLGQLKLKRYVAQTDHYFECENIEADRCVSEEVGQYASSTPFVPSNTSD